ncbi:hypothetical protein NAL32_16495 [Chryseobacterium sp. Ch-15]|uniref:Lipoprotein n=1 Tax=Chryseobacterium muglaense TaxID=2893752 RepID=A0A9Q3YTG4_9FLAO|nr:hypothetical protein [Chryseobacterium muglaense]MBD3906223.1 hypothetical protein [Chryseobacterium muglaense]MCC9036804.1 hypothetical protein [Chryseobacterium muglaense]MCM2555985.1 hypothetical protein [Chryseobacterium muglaense]
MKAYKIILISCLILVLSCKNHETAPKEKTKFQVSKYKEIPSKYIGKFSVHTETEATSTGIASISYYFTIKKNEAFLETNTYHEPIRCNGKYKIIDKADYIELYYDGEESNCKSEYPDFEIKKDKENFFIKGVGNEAASIDWQELKKNKN